MVGSSDPDAELRSIAEFVKRVVIPESTLAFVSTAFNEAGNLVELHRRCRAVHADLQRAIASDGTLHFRMVVADNASKDGSLAVLQALCQKDPDILVLANQTNCGPEASAVNALKHVLDCDLIVLLCSDLQDPPELAVSMARRLLEQPELDAVLALKTRSTGGPLLRLSRRLYYRVLGYSSRLIMVPSGFHGFGCYRSAVVHEALRFWGQTDLNLRQCLINATPVYDHILYTQKSRQYGTSSYRGWGYWREAFNSVAVGDAIASRLALLIGTLGLVLALVVGMLLLLNFLGGKSGYEGGVPTLMGLVILSFAVQMLMFSLLSRQIEAVRMGGFRPQVRFRQITAGDKGPMENQKMPTGSDGC
jgi:glycosyltransferase involved in cell wall biosynthesis